MQFPILTKFAYIIHSITPSKTENKAYFSLSGICTTLRCANLSIELLSDLIFMKINSSVLGRNTNIGVFGVSLDAMADIVDEMEINPDIFADASDTE